ncbi:MAG: SUMF1/EgtB/PvdO family nonheme iron enzyme [Polyangiaceae bacterium]|nr:SUMF1/EgtB/PvdO family nonheme iron enzyme [Polyangiaceae bacterium]
MTLGTHLGTLRRVQPVDDFEISRSLVTVSEYAECVSSRICQPAPTDCPTSASSQSPQPARCISAKDASAFCKWHGGALPTQGQWMLAARGPSVLRFPWGNSHPRCENKQHWRAGLVVAGAAGNGCCDGDCESRAVLGRMAPAPTGLADVLFTPAEMVRGGAVGFLGCASGATCLVVSRAPGAIDSVVSYDTRQGIGAGFRCAWGGE